MSHHDRAARLALIRADRLRRGGEPDFLIDHVLSDVRASSQLSGIDDDIIIAVLAPHEPASPHHA